MNPVLIGLLLKDCFTPIKPLKSEYPILTITFNTFSYTLFGLTSACVITQIADDLYKRFYNQRFSNITKYGFIGAITIAGFVRGITGKSLF